MFVLLTVFIWAHVAFAGPYDTQTNRKNAPLINYLNHIDIKYISVEKIQQLSQVPNIEPEMLGLLQAWLYTRGYFQPEACDTKALEHFFIGLIEMSHAQQAFLLLKEKPYLKDKLFQNPNSLFIRYFLNEKNHRVIADLLYWFPDLQKEMVQKEGVNPLTALEALFFESPRHGLWVALSTPTHDALSSTSIVMETLKSSTFSLEPEELLRLVKQLQAKWPDLLVHLNRESEWVRRLFDLPANFLEELLETHPKVLTDIPHTSLYVQLLQSESFNLDVFLILRKLRDKNPLSPSVLLGLHHRLKSMETSLTDVDLTNLSRYARQVFTDTSEGQESFLLFLLHTLPHSVVQAWLAACPEIAFLQDVRGRFALEFLQLRTEDNFYTFIEICLQKTKRKGWLERWATEPQLLSPSNTTVITRYLLGSRQHFQDQERVLLWRLLAKLQDLDSLAFLLKSDGMDVWLEDEEDGLHFFQWLLVQKETPSSWLEMLLFYKPELGTKPFSKNKPSSVMCPFYSEGMTPLEWASLHSHEVGLKALLSPFASPYTARAIQSLLSSIWVPPRTMQLIRSHRPTVSGNPDSLGQVFQFPSGVDPITAEWLSQFKESLETNKTTMHQIKESLESYLLFFKHFESKTSGQKAQSGLHFLFNDQQHVERERDLFLAMWLVAHQERFSKVRADLRWFLFSALRNMTHLIERQHPQARDISFRLFLSAVPSQDGRFHFHTPYPDSFKQALRQKMQRLIPSALESWTEEPSSDMSKQLQDHLEEALWQSHPEIPTRQLRQFVRTTLSILRKHISKENT